MLMVARSPVEVQEMTTESPAARVDTAAPELDLTVT
jgi:hypothetical protein